MSHEGTVVLNYRLGRKLGEGGFGAVYLAEHTELGRKSACKVLHREFASKPEVVDRFFREAKSVCAIGHRAIIEIENFGRLPSGEPFYLMEYFPGEALSDRVDRVRLRPDEALVVFEPVASALTAAHAKHIIHRDLKPENIMVLEEGGRIIDVKLFDFGIAKLVGEADSVRSRSGLAMGTPSYMSPEQARDAKGVDIRTDVYSFGATVYAAFAGRPPFAGDSVAGVLLKVQTDPPFPLAQLVPGVPPRLQAILERCLAKDPAQRPASIDEAWREIRATLGGAQFVAGSVPAPSYEVAPTLPPDALTVAPTAAPVVAAPRGVVTTLGSAAAESTGGPRRSSRARWLVLAGGLAIAGALAAVVILRDRSGGPSVPTEDPTSAANAREPTAIAASSTSAAGSAEPAAPDPGVPHGVAADPSTATVAPVAAIVEPPRPITVDPPPPTAAPVAAPVAEPPRPSKKPRLPAVKPAAVKPPPVTPPPPTQAPPVTSPETPRLECSVASFARTYEKPSPAEDEVRAALRRLNQCRSQLAPQQYGNLQKNLVSKL